MYYRYIYQGPPAGQTRVYFLFFLNTLWLYGYFFLKSKTIQSKKPFQITILFCELHTFLTPLDQLYGRDIELGLNLTKHILHLRSTSGGGHNLVTTMKSLADLIHIECCSAESVAL